MPRYAGFNPADPAPQRVTGWYDTDLCDYGPGKLPGEGERIEMTEALWARRLDCEWEVQHERLVPRARPDPSKQQPRPLGKQEVLDRLIATKRLRAFRAVLGLDIQDASELPDQVLELRERWLANDVFRADEVPLRQALATAGADPDQVLKV